MKTRKIYNKTKTKSNTPTTFKSYKNHSLHNEKIIKGGKPTDIENSILQILNLILKDVSTKQNDNSKAIINIIKFIINNYNNVKVKSNSNRGLSLTFSGIPIFTEIPDVTTLNVEFNKKNYKYYNEKGVLQEIPRLVKTASNVSRKYNPFNNLWMINDTIKKITKGEKKDPPVLKYNVNIDNKITPDIKQNVSII